MTGRLICQVLQFVCVLDFLEICVEPEGYQMSSPPLASLRTTSTTRGSMDRRSLFWRKYLLNTDLIDQMLSP